MGLFIATDEINIVPGPPLLDLLSRWSLLTVGGVRSATSSATRSAARSGHRSTSATAGSSSRSTSTRPTAFFDKHGNKALVIGRFVPFVRTYITVVAGVTQMDRAPVLAVERSSAPSLWVAQHHACSATSSGAAFPGLGENID